MPSNCAIAQFPWQGGFGEVARTAPQIFGRDAFNNDLGNIDAGNFNEC